MALIGLVRVSTDEQNTRWQHDALDSICRKVFEEKISGKPAVDDRPGLTSALDYLRIGDMLSVQEVDRPRAATSTCPASAVTCAWARRPPPASAAPRRTLRPWPCPNSGLSSLTVHTVSESRP
ncbi:recombinase family protein [Streptosporangium sp. NBC_01639]|uniref:recombinase family protein n=1 Tax=Streptosporangium sp. NBC_01639 TaxID=2975948 RepID=UPI00386B63F7|nr:recombinase family protein [Streptosporangium sp. NBC_01639]